MDQEKADVKEKIRSMWEDEREEFYGKVLDEFDIDSGDIPPNHAQRLDEVEDEMIEVLTDWISWRLNNR